MILVTQESILLPQESILVAQELILVPQESILIDFSKVFQCFWPATAATAAGNPRAIRRQFPAQKSGTARRTPQGRIQESFFPLEEPYSETLLGKKSTRRVRLSVAKLEYTSRWLVDGWRFR